MSDKLNPRQELFIAEYLRLKNATAAYIAAGYKPKGAEAAASRMLRNVKVSEAIEDHRTKVREKTVLNATSQIDNLEELRLRCMEKEEIRDSQGNPTGVYKFDSRGALGAIKLIGDHLGMWEKREGEARDITPRSYDPSKRREILATIMEKRRDDAFQVKVPAKVLIQPTPSDSKEVGSGNPVVPDFAGGQVPNPQPGRKPGPNGST